MATIRRIFCKSLKGLKIYLELLWYKWPLNNDHLSTTVTFWVPMVVVVHRFDCMLHISFRCMFWSKAARIRTASVWDFCSWCTLNLDVATNLVRKCLTIIHYFRTYNEFQRKTAKKKKEDLEITNEVNITSQMLLPQCVSPI